jgi:hypothetical protein
MDLPPELLAAFPPSANRLLDVARRSMDDWMLREISWADYGMDAEEHFQALRPIRDTGVIPVPLVSPPLEVLCLIRWDDPESLTVTPGMAGERGHQIRTFACAVLLRAAAALGGESGDDMEGYMLGMCLESAKVLGNHWSEATARFLTWQIPRMGRSRDRLAFIFVLLVLATRLRSGRIADHTLGDTAEWFLTEEEALSRLEETEMFQEGFWSSLSADLIENAAAVPTVDVRDKLEFIGAFLRES